MRAMILAAGLGTRLRPLTDFCAKPALPIRGRPVISLLLDFLARQGVEDVMINLHYLPQTIRAAVEADCPENITIAWSEESEPLGTGGGIRRAADFLSAVDDCVVLAGDMLIDVDLGALLEAHRASPNDATLVLREDPRSADFGTIGTDAGGRVSRVGKRITGSVDTGPEQRAGLFTGVRLFSRRVFGRWPECEVFEDLRGWLIPGLERGHFEIGGLFVDPADTVWEPVGTPREYLQMNLDPPSMRTLGGPANAWSGDIRLSGARSDVILGRGCAVGDNAELERVVVWEDEKVPANFTAQDGVFAAGRFHDCGPAAGSVGQEH